MNLPLLAGCRIAEKTIQQFNKSTVQQILKRTFIR